MVDADRGGAAVPRRQFRRRGGRRRRRRPQHALFVVEPRNTWVSRRGWISWCSGRSCSLRSSSAACCPGCARRSPRRRPPAASSNRHRQGPRAGLDHPARRDRRVQQCTVARVHGSVQRSGSGLGLCLRPSSGGLRPAAPQVDRLASGAASRSRTRHGFEARTGHVSVAPASRRAAARPEAPSSGGTAPASISRSGADAAGAASGAGASPAVRNSASVGRAENQAGARDPTTPAARLSLHRPETGRCDWQGGGAAGDGHRAPRR